MASHQDVSRKVATDRGFAWVVLLASFVVNYLTGVLVFSVGILHVELLHKFREDVTTTAWAGSLYSGLMMFAAPLGSALVYAHSCRISVMAGSVFLCVGFVASAFATSVLQLIFTYGLIAGLGLGLAYSPSITVVSFYFAKYRPVATGLSLSSFGLGILTGSLIIQAFIDRYGLSGAFLMIAGLGLQISVFAMLYFPTQHDGQGRRRRQNHKGSSQQREVVVWKCSEDSDLLESPDDVFNKELYANAKHQDLPLTVIEENDGEIIMDKTWQDSATKISSKDPEKETPVSVYDSVNDSDQEKEKGMPLLITQEKNPRFHKTDKNSFPKEGLKTRPNPSTSSPSLSSPRQRRIVRAFSGVCSLLHNWPFLFHCCCGFFASMTMNGAYLHLPEYARTQGTPSGQAARLSIGVGVFSFLSRFGSGVLVTSFKINSLVLSVVLLGLCSLSCCLFPLFSGTYAGQMIFASVYGLANGGFYALYFIATVLLVDFQALPAAYGIMIFIAGAGYMAGPTLAGMIVDYGGTYTHSFVFLGLDAFVAAAFELCTKIVHNKQTNRHDDV